jgi:hypothetical protein
MAAIRTVATFESSAFNATERRDYFINDCCYGDDVAAWLIDELGARGVETDAEPGQEDFGWYFGFKKGGIDYTFIIGHRPADAETLPTWIGFVERKRGRLGALLRGSERGVDPEAVLAIHSVLNSSLLVRNLKWHFRRDFDAGREELGQAQPAG